jgi:hypothetical protein
MDSLFANHVFIVSTLSAALYFPATLLVKALVKGAQRAV